MCDPWRDLAWLGSGMGNASADERTARKEPDKNTNVLRTPE
jgi:hypothetical protein